MGANLKRRLAIKKIFIIIIIILLGLCYDIALIFSFEKNDIKDTDLELVAEVIGIKIEKEYYDKYVIKVFHCEDIDSLKNKKLILYVDSNISLLPGDIIKIKGHLNSASASRNYKGFDYSKYLKQSKIYGILLAEEISVIKNKIDYYSIIGKIRFYLNEQIKIIYDKTSYTFLTGMLLGNAEEIDSKTEESFKNSNLSHIIAISGSHLVYVIMIFEFVLNKFIYNKKIKNYLLILILLFFTLVTGETVSCIRAFIMSSLVLISSNSCRKNNFYIGCLISFLIIIILNPYNLFNIGMLLSYAGTIGIVMFYKIFSRIIERKISNKLINYLVKLALVSISAQILIIPIMLYSFNNLSLNFVISNVLVSFFVGPSLIIGYLSLFVSFIFPRIKLIIFIEKIIIRIIILIAEVCGKIPFSNIYVCTPNIIFIFLYYCAIIKIAYLYRVRKLYVIKLMVSLKFLKSEILKILLSLKFKKFCGVIIIFIFCSNIFDKNANLEIHFIDVGQGDCSFITTPSGKKIIVDAGEGEESGYDYGKNVLLPYLLDKGVRKIDYVIISHCDSDHIGGIFNILENMNVKKVIIGIQPENSENLISLINICQKQKIEILVLEMGERYMIDNNVFIDIIWPSSEKIISENALNNNSLVFKLIYNDFSMLFTGDIEEIAENSILEMNENKLEADILKVAHHGSKTSSIKEFLKEVNPKIVLIGVGEKNKFGHPNMEVLERIKMFTNKIYRTDLDGEISIEITSKGRLKAGTHL